MIDYKGLPIKVIGAFLTLIIGLILASTLINIVRRFLKGIEVNKLLNEQLKINIKFEEYIISILKYLIYFITLTLILTQLGASSRVLFIIAITFLVLISIFVIIAFKDWIPNLISNIYLKKTNKIKVGDIIKIRGVKGKVIAINVLETKIETINKEIIFIPNANLTKYDFIIEREG